MTTVQPNMENQRHQERGRTGTRVCVGTRRWRVLLLVLVSFGVWKGLVEPMESPGPYHQGPPVLRRTISELKAKLRVGDEVCELVIVPGRSVYVGSNFLLAKDDSNWVIQVGVLEGQAKTLTEHMKVANNPNAMLLFSEMDAKRNRVRPFMLRL